MDHSRPEIRARIRRRENPWANLVIGLTILGCGVIFWLDHLGRLDAREYLHWWPIALIAVGLAQLPQRQWVSGAIWLAVGSIFLLPLLGFPTISIFRIVGIWPLLYTVAGVALVMQALRWRADRGGFNAVAVMGANVRRLGALEFTGGDAVAVMGACEIDFSAARLTGQAVLDVVAFWGGIGIRVPRGWRIVLDATTIMGGLLDMTEPAPDTAPQLVVRGSIIMGGVEVRHTADLPA
jgi:hypothetical protein